VIEGETRSIWRRRGNFPHKLSGKRTLIGQLSGEAFLNVIRERTDGASLPLQARRISQVKGQRARHSLNCRALFFTKGKDVCSSEIAELVSRLLRDFVLRNDRKEYIPLNLCLPGRCTNANSTKSGKIRN